jgi:hypothetical protein
MSKAPKGHWEREKAGRLNSVDIAHERNEKFGHECKEHGLNIRECEGALLKAQKDKYKDKPGSKFRL